MDYTEADAVIDFTEIHVLDVQPLPAWQRRVLRHLFTEPAPGHPQRDDTGPRA